MNGNYTPSPAKGIPLQAPGPSHHRTRRRSAAPPVGAETGRARGGFCYNKFTLSDGGRMHKILLVDDMRRFLDLERSFLQRVECRILTAVTGLEAIKVAKTQMPDIILLDVEMPEMNGLEAARILKNDPQTRHIPIIIYTALEGVEERARASGCDDFRRKPLDEDAFLEVIGKFVPLKIRKVPRAALEVPAVLKENDREFQGRCVNISTTGIYLQSAYRPIVGTLLEIRFPLPVKGEEKRITSLAYTVRQGEDGLGCAFYDLSTGAELYIREFLAEQQTGTA